MAEFHQLTEDQKVSSFQMIYHVGHWMSGVDTTGGEVSQEQEKKALKETLQKCTRRYRKSVFVTQLLRETLEREMHWERWADDNIDVIPLVKSNVAMIEENVGITEAAALKILIMEIAVHVARAYREFDDVASGMQKMMSKIKQKVCKVTQPVSKHSSRASLDLLDISEHEEYALNTLANELGFRTFENYRLKHENHL